MNQATLALEGSAWAPRHFLLVAVYLVLYLLLDWASLIHPWGSTAITPWNPPPALSLALLLVFGFRFGPALFVAALAADLLVRDVPVPFGYSLAGAVIIAGGYWSCAHVLAVPLRIGPQLRGTRDLGWLFAVVGIGGALIGALFVGVYCVAGLVEWRAMPQALLRYWIGDVVGIVVNLPFLLTMADPAARRTLAGLLRSWEALAQAAVVGLALWFVFGASPVGHVKYFYLFFVPVIWIAARHGLAGTTAVVVAIQICLILGVETRDSDVATVLELQARMLALAATGLFLGVAVDERRRAQANLEQSMRLAAAGEMAGALGHELNQPLSAIVTYGKACDLMLSRPDRDDARIEETVRKIVQQSQRVAAIVRRLRDFLRSGTMELRAVPVTELIDGVRAGFERALSANGTRFEIAIASGLPPVWIDKLEIEVVLRNLIANAQESIHESRAVERVIRLDASRHGAASVRISVFDTGPGVPAPMRERLFAPFATSKASGLGMGLAVSRAIVEAHGGRLWAEPAAHGAFHVILPTTRGDPDEHHKD